MLSDGTVSFGALLRRLRLAANLTHRALSALSGLSVDTISMLERGARQTPRRSTLVALAQGLRLPPAEREALFAAVEPAVSGRARPETRSAPPAYPGMIAGFWGEAHDALAAGLPRAAAAMALRAVRGVCDDHEATDGRDLSDQVEELGRTRSVHPTIVEWAHQIRLLRQPVGQALLTGIDAVTPAEAVCMVEFLDELLQFAYDLPERLGRLKAGASHGSSQAVE
jgi:transcriptional regulator with XRE-family HTH domain